MKITTLNIFFEEPDPDRWIKFDRYPRKFIRRIIRGKQRPGGVMMVALELIKGLDLLKIPYRFNDYTYARKHPEELIGIIGKPHLIFEKRFTNPILFGAGVYSHPIECPDLFEKYPNVKKILVPGAWMKLMCKPFYHEKVEAWPVGIDTEKWHPKIKVVKPAIDFLIYDKIRWEHDKFEIELINPILNELKSQNLSYDIIRYGHYNHEELIQKLGLSKAVIFLCEHETQGIAYQQILATNTPILAWDRGGFWQDPSYYPNKVKYQPVSSVPYWDDRCGIKFKTLSEFNHKLEEFLNKGNAKLYSPRNFILDNLSLTVCAKKYIDIYNSLKNIC